MLSEASQSSSKCDLDLESDGSSTREEGSPDRSGVRVKSDFLGAEEGWVGVITQDQRGQKIVAIGILPEVGVHTLKDVL